MRPTHRNNLEILYTLFVTTISLIFRPCNSAALAGITDYEARDILRESINQHYTQNVITSIRNIQTEEDYILRNISKHCQTHLAEWFYQLNNSTTSELWALKMIDAWAKFPEGILSGHLVALGDFDECLGIQAQEPSNIKGKYCLSIATTNFNSSLMFQVGTCYPSSCSQSDVTQFHQNANALGLIKFPIISEVKTCFTDDKPSLNSGEIAVIFVLAVLVALCIVGSVVDVQSQKSNLKGWKGLGKDLVLAFSVPTNTKKLLSTKESGESITCIHGIRCLTTCWIILGHTWDMVNRQPTWNTNDYLALPMRKWPFIVITNFFMAVDTFFTLGGLLVAFATLRKIDKEKGRFNVLMFYIHRYIRITPTNAILIGITATLYPHFGSGPYWDGIEIWSSFCRKNWHHSILYINNVWDYSHIGDDSMCRGDSWYLANDMQYFILSPFLLYPLWKWERIGLMIMTIATIASVVIPTVVTYNLDILPTFITTATLEQKFSFTVHGYMKPWMRISPYMVGLWAGYFLYKVKASPKKTKTSLNKLLMVGGWCIASATALAIVFGLRPYYDVDTKMPTLSSALYAGFHRFAWGIVIAWIIIACKFGYGGWINKLLSWKMFIPLGRLTFCTYLVSFSLQLLFHLRIRQAVMVETYSMTYIFLAHLVVSFFVGFLCCITMESPFLAVEKIIFSERASTKKQTQTK